MRWWPELAILGLKILCSELCLIDESAQKVFVVNIVVQVLLGSFVAIQLRNTVIVLGNIRELELLSIHVSRVYSNGEIINISTLFKKISFHKESIEELLFIEGNAEVFPGRFHFHQIIFSSHDSVFLLLFNFLLRSFELS